MLLIDFDEVIVWIDVDGIGNLEVLGIIWFDIVSVFLCVGVLWFEMGILIEMEEEVELSCEVLEFWIVVGLCDYVEVGDDEEDFDDLLVGLGFVELVEEKWKFVR